MAALGAETASGDFEVFEYCFAGLPSQPALEPASPEGEWVAIASGLKMGSAGDAADLRTEMLVEFLLGEAGEEEASLGLGCTPSAPHTAADRTKYYRTRRMRSRCLVSSLPATLWPGQISAQRGATSRRRCLFATSLPLLYADF